MFPVKYQNKRWQSIALILVIALAAIVGLLMVMNRLAAPDTAATSAPTVNSAGSAVTPTITLPPPNTRDDIVAIVNQQPITRETWDTISQLDRVMNGLAGQPKPTAEETLDRLINEILVLAEVSDVPPPTDAEIDERTAILAQTWDVSTAEITQALEEANLTQADFTDRVGRLIRVETALNHLAAQENDLNDWLAQARASAEIGLYRALANPPPTPAAGARVEATAAEESPETASEENGEIAAAPTFAPPPGMPAAPYVDNAAPDFTLPQLDNESLSVSDSRGKPTLINFWASWCPPCRRELPALQAAYESYGDTIGFLAIDVKEEPQTVNGFVEEMGLTFPILLDQDGQVSDVAYEVRGIPTTIFVDANGVVAARHVGPLDEAAIDSYLAPLLEEAKFQATTQPTEAPLSPTDEALTMITSEGVEPTNESADPAPTLDQSTPAPNFVAISGKGDTIELQDYLEQNHIVLVFYRGNT